MSAVSGLAASIRAAVESETFDLAGQNASTIEKMVRDAFSEPLPLAEMIRLTFVTGAGKLARQKYDENAAKCVTSTLRELGFEEDRAASAVLECAGTFKLQHDTGKNLKTVVVFPKVTGKDAANDVDVGGLNIGGGKSKSAESLLEVDSPEHKTAYTSMNVFKKMVESKCPSWSQKKGCVEAIESLKKQLSSFDDKLMKGTPLTDAEQDMYDSVSMSVLDEKLSYVRDLMHKQIDDGKITAEERTILLTQVEERLSTLAKEIDEAEKAGKGKRVENLKAALEKATQRKEKLSNISPKPPAGLKNDPQINQLRKELQPLLEMEEAAKGRLLSIKETQSLARKDEILSEISELENASRGWFESDEEFQIRIEASRAAFRAKSKAQAKKKPAPSAAKPGALPGRSAGTAKTTWSTPASRKGTTSAWGQQPKTKSKNNNLFAAMMNDSDSD